MITAGKYTGKVADYCTKTSKEGKPHFVVWFNIEGQGSVQWKGHMTDKTMESTIRTLVLLGYRGADFHEIGEGVTSGALDTNTEFLLAVEMEKDMKDPSKAYPRVRFVNPMKAPKYDQHESKVAATKLSAYSGLLAKVKSDMGVRNEPGIGF